MACEGYQEQISQLVDNELGERESPALFAHLGTCEVCRRFLHTTLRLRAELQEDEPLLASSRLDQKAMGIAPSAKRYVLDRSAARSFVGRRRISLPLPAAALLTLLLVALMAATSSLWYPTLHPEAVPRVQTVYVTTYPTVEVDGYYQRPNTRIQ
jgi:anti-sigma factor RsiW